MCVEGPWGSQAEEERESRLFHPSGLHQAASLYHTGPDPRAAAAGLTSPVQLLPEEHSVPGLHIQPMSHSERDVYYHYLRRNIMLTRLAFDQNKEMCYSILNFTLKTSSLTGLAGPIFGTTQT